MAEAQGDVARYMSRSAPTSSSRDAFGVAGSRGASLEGGGGGGVPVVR